MVSISSVSRYFCSLRKPMRVYPSRSSWPLLTKGNIWWFLYFMIYDLAFYRIIFFRLGCLQMRLFMEIRYGLWIIVSKNVCCSVRPHFSGCSVRIILNLVMPSTTYSIDLWRSRHFLHHLVMRVTIKHSTVFHIVSVNKQFFYSR